MSCYRMCVSIAIASSNRSLRQLGARTDGRTYVRRTTHLGEESHVGNARRGVAKFTCDSDRFGLRSAHALPEMSSSKEAVR